MQREQDMTSDVMLESSTSDTSAGHRIDHGGEWIKKAIAIYFAGYTEEDIELEFEHYQKLSEHMQTKCDIDRIARALEATHTAAVVETREECAKLCDDYYEQLERDFEISSKGDDPGYAYDVNIYDSQVTAALAHRIRSLNNPPLST